MYPVKGKKCTQVGSMLTLSLSVNKEIIKKNGALVSIKIEI